MENNLYSGGLVIYNNNPNDINEVIKSFFLNNQTINKLIVIDNSDNNFYKYLDSDKRLIYIKTSKNLGFGKAHNIGIKHSIDILKCKYHVILNPDISFKKNTIINLINVLETDSKIGLISPSIYNENGELQYLCKLIPRPLDLIIRLLPLKMFLKKKSCFTLQNLNYNKPIQAPYLSGCFMVLRNSVLSEVGFFDERFFMYPEDIDLTRRIHSKYKTLYWPNVEIIHRHEKASFKSFRMLGVHIINMIKYFNKWGWIFDNERKKVNNIIKNQIQ